MLPSLIDFRGLAITSLLIALISASADAACRKIVVSSRAEYMELDPETLTTLRVGDLHWLGIYRAGFQAGSSFGRALVSTEPYFKINSVDPVFEFRENPEVPVEWIPVEFPPFFKKATLFLENMGENLRSQDEIPVMVADPPYEYRGVQWADWIEENALIRETFHQNQGYVESYELLNTNFDILRQWDTEVGFSFPDPSCSIGNSVYFAGGRGIHVFNNLGEAIYELEELRNEGLRLVPPHTKNCKALAFRDTPHEDPMFGAVLVDVVAGTWGPEFAVHKFGEYILYDDGRRLLQQRREGKIIVENSNTYGYPGDHANQFSLIDTTTGEVLLERELGTGSGELSREMLCDNETPRALVKEGNTMHLIDPNTLEITASRTLPEIWNGGYVVFE